VYQQATKEQKHDMVVLYEVWEWRRTPNNAAQDPWTSDHGWEKLTIEASDSNDPWDHTRERAEEKLRLQEGEFGEYIVGLATNNGAWPFMVATDGGHKHFMEMKEGGKTGAWTSAAMVVLEAPKNNGRQGWERTTTRPALVRVTTLPQHIGTTETSNGHGELLPCAWRERSHRRAYQLSLLQTRQWKEAEQWKCGTAATTCSRDTKSGKYLGEHQNALLCEWTSEECDLPRQELGEEEWAVYTSNYAETTMEMRTLGELTGWKEEYWDQHLTTTIWKVDSHQLKENGAKGDRYDSIIPCQFLVPANHLADRAASIGIATLPVLDE
jgi:hypothetical protein